MKTIKNNKDIFYAWLNLFKTNCDWPVYPEAWEAWNEAIEQVAKYTENCFCESGFDSMNMEKVADKIRKKFKT